MLIYTSYHSWICRLTSQGTRWFPLCEVNVYQYKCCNTNSEKEFEGSISFRNFSRQRLISEKRYCFCHDFDNPKSHLFKLCYCITVTETLNKGRSFGIWGIHDVGYDEHCLVGCDVFWYSPTLKMVSARAPESFVQPKNVLGFTS